MYKGLRVRKVFRVPVVRLVSLDHQVKQAPREPPVKTVCLERRAPLVPRETPVPQGSQVPEVPPDYLAAQECLASRVRGVWLACEASRESSV